MGITMLTVKRIAEFKDPDFMGSNPKHCPTLFVELEIRIDLQLCGQWPMTQEHRAAQAIATDMFREGRGGEAVAVLDSVGFDCHITATGVAGYVLTAAQARAEARRNMESYWEEMSDADRQEWNAQQDKRIRSAKSFAKYVLDCDGEYHGLEVHDDRGDTVLVGHSWGCIHDELRAHFPEAECVIADHLKKPQIASYALVASMLEHDRRAA